MTDNWTFGQRMAVGFASIVSFALVIALVAVVALQAVVSAKDQVIDGASTEVVAAEVLRTTYEQRAAAIRGYALSSQPHLLEEAREAKREFDRKVLLLERVAPESLIGRLRAAEGKYQLALDEIVSMVQAQAPLDQVAATFERNALPARTTLGLVVTELSEDRARALSEARDQATARAQLATMLLVGMGALAIVVATAASALLTRSLGQQIGSAVSQVDSSSTELQAAASQQATGAREQASAMNEIGTTITELLATSRQIAESAQRVVHIAEQTAGGATSGMRTVEQTRASIGAIRSQVDVIVAHMLELGQKSQQIGGVLAIVSELSDQTNILAINATIEAAGAGEAGRRFGVVADEIRKLADRVSGSTKEIRLLIDEVRGAVNTTVMATESGSKAVDAGARSFSDVGAALQHIASMVGTTNEAAREIQLSTQQQATAVEQVNLAIANVAQATRETEASASQTLQTAGELTSLSRTLLKLIRPKSDN